MEHVESQVLFENVLINGTGSAESPAIDLRLGPSFPPYGIALKASSAGGTADVKLQVATSEDGVNFSDYADHADVISSTLTERPGGPELWNDYPLADIFNKFLKFKVTGVNSNPTDTLVSATLLIHVLC